MKNMLSNNIKILRGNLSIDTISKFLNIDPIIYIKYESGELEIPTDNITKLSKLFGVYEHDLYHDIITDSPFNSSVVSLTLTDLDIISNFRNIALNYLKINKMLQDVEERN